MRGIEIASGELMGDVKPERRQVPREAPCYAPLVIAGAICKNCGDDITFTKRIGNFAGCRNCGVLVEVKLKGERSIPRGGA